MPGEPEGGHYVVVTSVEKTRIRMIDGTAVWLVTRTNEDLGIVWSGYILEPTAVNGALFALESLMSAATLVGWLVAGLVWALRRRKTVFKCLLIAVILSSRFSGVAACASSHQQGKGDDDDAYWRVPENDGANCLYLLLRLHGQPVRYNVLRSAFYTDAQEWNLASLKNASLRFGLAATIRKLGPGDLTPRNLPLIAHLKDAGSHGGCFVLVFQVADDNFFCILGDNATIERIPADEFLRRWSGYVMSSTREGLQQDTWWLSGGVATAMLAVYLMYRVFPMSARLSGQGGLRAIGCVSSAPDLAEGGRH